jgi:hypothetical protein
MIIYIPTNGVWGTLPHPTLPHPASNGGVFLATVIVTGLRWKLNVLLICMSFMAKDAGCHFMSLLAICTFSFENCLLIY